MTEKDLQEVLDEECKENNLPPLLVIITNNKRGYASWRKQLITIPSWAFKYGEAYTLYYLLHEFAHIVVQEMWGKGLLELFPKSHGVLFRSIENSLLDKWGISFQRSGQRGNGRYVVHSSVCYGSRDQRE